MRTIIVATGKNAPNGFGVQKYDNEEPWNVVNGAAPNGVNATRWLRKTTPDRSKLTSLAAFLVEHCSGCVAGNYPAANADQRVRIYNGLTVADQGKWDDDQKRCWHPMGEEPARIDDWHFDQIRFDESDEDFWNRTSAAMIEAGAVRVTIGNAEWRK